MGNVRCRRGHVSQPDRPGGRVARTEGLRKAELCGAHEDVDFRYLCERVIADWAGESGNTVHSGKEDTPPSLARHMTYTIKIRNGGGDILHVLRRQEYRTTSREISSEMQDRCRIGARPQYPLSNNHIWSEDSGEVSSREPGSEHRGDP